MTIEITVTNNDAEHRVTVVVYGKMTFGADLIQDSTMLLPGESTKQVIHSNQFVAVIDERD